ncbi:MAG: lysophospholipid acyltransferase family protein [Armatimonadetes bacterium]|nr:lysophospholipid acyltransferase family protein [Armatimonadota bacterium]
MAVPQPDTRDSGSNPPGGLHQAFKRAKRAVVNAFVRRALRWLTGKVRRMSPDEGYRLADRLARIVYRIYPTPRRTSVRQLRRAFGDRYSAREREEIAWKSFRNLFRTVIEFLRLPVMTREEILDLASESGAEYLKQAMSLGRGVIVMSAHYDNWELTAARMAADGYKVNAIIREANDAQVNAFVNEARERFGMHSIGRDDLRAAIQCLRRNEGLAILADQNIQKGGVWVEFFGHPATAAPGPAVLALRTGAPIVPVFIMRDEQNHHHIRFFPPLELVRTDDTERDIQENTALITRTIEEQVALHPEQWMWSHPRWRRAEQLGLTPRDHKATGKRPELPAD